MPANQFDNEVHNALFFSGTSVVSGQNFSEKWSDLILSALRNVGVFDNVVISETPPVDRSLIWLDTRPHPDLPSIPRVSNPDTLEWNQVTFEDLFGRGPIQHPTRSEFVAAVSGRSFEDGRIAFDGKSIYKYSLGATAISGLPNWLPFGKVHPNHWAENLTPGTTDMSSAINSASAYVNGLGGGEVHFLAETYGAQELLIDNRTSWVGERGVTTIRLLDNSDTYLLGSASYVNNQAFGNINISTTGIIFDGNKDNNTTNEMVAMSCFRYSALECEFIQSAGIGLVLTTTTIDGVTSTTPQSFLNENIISKNSFDRNDGPGLYIRGETADVEIIGNHFNTNGGRNQANVFAERFAGSKFVNNQVYNGGFHCLSVARLGRSVITGNHFDLRANDALAGDRVACISVGSIDDFSPSVVTDNALYIGSEQDSSTIDMHGISLTANSSGAVLFGNSSITDDTTQKGATALYAVPAAAAGLDNITWLPDALRDIDQGTPLRFEWTGTTESGSNANGNYVRHGDGTLFCWGEVELTFSAAAQMFGTWTYPFPFISTATTFPDGSIDHTTAGTGLTPSREQLGQLTFVKASAATCQVSLFRQAGQTNFGASDTVTINMFAAGRWE